MMAVLQPHILPTFSLYLLILKSDSAYEEREEFTSPVPTQIVPVFQSTAISPMFV
jgi:hypothetical protein